MYTAFTKFITKKSLLNYLAVMYILMYNFWVYPPEKLYEKNSV